MYGYINACTFTYITEIFDFISAFFLNCTKKIFIDIGHKYWHITSD